MEHPGFFQKAGPFSLEQICQALEVVIDDSCQTQELDELMIDDVKSISSAGSCHLTFFEDRKGIETFQSSKAAVCITTENFKSKAPSSMIVLVCKKPHQQFVKAVELFYPGSHRSQTALSDASMIDESAVIEEGVDIEPGVVIGKEVHVGKGTRIAAGSVIGYRTYIGRDCMIGPNATITHALVGNHVTIHAGVSVGQDGFGYIMSGQGHTKVPQIGRVIIQDHVEIGANSAIDRGSLEDTIIGEGSKIDNLVQIAHNVVIGCHTVIAGQTGIAGSTKIGNFVAMGGQAGAAGHIEIGDGAQIAASSNVYKSVPAKGRYGGTPAKPMDLWFKEIIAVEKMIEKRDANLKKVKKPDLNQD